MSTPNFHHQQTAQRMHQQASQNAQRAHQTAVDAARRAGRPMGSNMSPSMRWSGGSTYRGPFSLVGFLFKVALLVGIAALAITFGPRLVDEVQTQVDTGTGTGTGTEVPAPEGP